MDETQLAAALNKAASSSDPAVRAMALTYREQEMQLERLREFFSFYVEGVAANSKMSVTSTSNNAVVTSKISKVGSAEKKRGPSVKSGAFTAAIIEILQNSAEPVKLQELKIAYEALNLEPPMQDETFRQRMISRQRSNEVVLIPRVGFWLPEPNGPKDNSPAETDADV